MQPNDRAAFKARLTDVLSFYRQDLSKFALGVWWQACEAFELDQVAKALTAHAMDPERGQFAPKPADVVRQLQGTHTDRSLLAWGKVLDAIQRVGAYQSVVFDDPAIHCAIEDLGGWTKVCRSSFDELPHLQRRFCEMHRAYTRQPAPQYPARLVGESEANNRTSGKPVAPPALIGDPAKAAKVLRLGGPGSAKTQITAGQAAAVALGGLLSMEAAA